MVLAVVATLLPFHFEPQTVFLPEIATAAALLGAVAMLRRGHGGVTLPLNVPTGILLVLLCALIPHLANGRVLSYGLYLGLALIALLAFHSSGSEGRDRWASAFAVMMLATALAQALCAVLQLAGFPLGGLVMRKIFTLAYGNIGQANHYADLIWLGLAGAVFLQARAIVGRGTFYGASAALVLAGALSGSRGVWLYTAAFAVLGLRLRFAQADEARKFARALWWIACCSVVAQILVAQEAFMALLQITAAADRLGDAGSNGQRLHDWAIAWEAARHHPWLGTGPGSFYSLSVEAAIAGPDKPFPMLAEHAHNLPFHLAAELGLPAAVLFCALLSGWFVVQLCKDATAVRYLALCGLSVIGLHSLVEYPLWYTYFLVPAALFLALADDGRAPVLHLPRLAINGICVVGWLCLGWVLHDWITVTHAQREWAEASRATSIEKRLEIRRTLARVPDFSLFGAEARNIEMRTWVATQATAPAMAAMCDARWKHLPDWTVMINCAQAYAASEQAAKLDQIMQALCRGFPRYHGLLRDWLETSPHLGGLDPTTRACLAEED
ncbi:Wzy polymerase domain-containing protein [Niveibacterium sp. SC-1]|uniref:PglL family O-oligosaccharyltransferase n=1 Tax=Niveibacterium sp. SC-1 TaxID=3135646 RepID=UPI00311FE2F7